VEEKGSNRAPTLLTGLLLRRMQWFRAAFMKGVHHPVGASFTGTGAMNS